MSNFKKNFQSFGKSLLFPISLLSFMAIFLGLAAALQNPAIIEVAPFLGNETLQLIFGFIRRLSALPFGYLPLLFAMSIPLGMVKRDKEVAVYAGAVGYIAMLLGMTYVLQAQGFTAETTSIAHLMDVEGLSQVDATLQNSLFTNTLGIFVYNTNVIGGILAGLMGVFLHNKFRETELHPALTFYSGKRFVPIAAAIILALVGIVLAFVWPLINQAIIAVGGLISESGSFGVFLYGFTEKIINPTGLHHILNQTFRFTALGGVENIDGESLVGALQIYLYQLDNNLAFSTDATAFLAQGKILHMVFGMPAAVLAMYKMARPEKRDRVLKFFLAGVTAVILTGITEPIEFTFIFISPILWVVNAIFAGLAFLVPALLDVAIGNIQGGIIDWIVFGMLQGMETKWYIYLVAGPIFFAMYYFSYTFIISKFNVMTIGRRETDFEDEEEVDDNVSVKESDRTTAEDIINGLGGLKNITDVDNCISRLRVEVKNGQLVDESLLRKTKPNGIVRPDANTVHVVYGGRISKMRNIVDNYMYEHKHSKE
ncbi:PTS system, maltose and glucose-specific IIC component [Alkalibacterium putridalgicola]|uniref:PTS maltose transporter subunit IICB n=1 Tax=Alkalibacterium putridalgicola TaxID=426703 RepID=A0A1H7WV56_9LACT|nr:PTS transporter subunit EIIC [Alkalibacterium putridalgicola]GEK90244.1 PTS maltose transporter subunit IICB [Alkalibacterium putridalgicola]SEM25393.1 PTS system, maltose and glucose-specific IIC component [Alkalibacterium putridalgicola]